MNTKLPAHAMALMLVCASATQAATFCVTTGNQLNAALSSAESNAQDDVIKVVRGTLISDTHSPGNYQWRFEPADNEYGLTISGGWDAANNCQFQTSLDPSQTILDARYLGPAFLVANGTDPYTGALRISNLTFYRGQTASFPSSAGIQLTINGGPGGQFIFDNILVTAGRSGGSSGRIAEFELIQAGFLKVRNSQFLNNSFTHSTSGGVRIKSTNGAVGYVTNNTISGNTATDASPGLLAIGTVTLSNNAAADNTSTVSPSYNFYSNAPTSLTLRNNHFQTRGTFNGLPFSETGGTNGDPGWTQIGSRMVPNAVSALRDSGLNSPSGGVPSVDFSGVTRIINGTIDRGAVEAPAITRMGPTLTATSPLDGSTTPVPGNEGEVIAVPVQFSVSGGIGVGTTQLTCIPAGGFIENIQNSVQTIAVGGTVTPLFVNISVRPTVHNAAMSCSATRENATTQGFYFNFTVGSDVLLSNSFE